VPKPELSRDEAILSVVAKENGMVRANEEQISGKTYVVYVAPGWEKACISREL
jgi:hypothetical protein